MLHAVTFNTLAVARKLEASGISTQQSEAITEAVAEIFETTLTTFATKSDIQQLDKKLNTKIEKMAFEFDGKLSTLKSELIIWMVSVVFAQTAILSIIKFMHPIS